MKLVIISTMNGFPWGGSEELWRATALYARQQGHEVKAVVSEKMKNHPKLTAIQEQGIEVFFWGEQSFKMPSLWKRLYSKLLKKPLEITYTNRFNFINSLKPDVILLSQGGVTDVTFYDDLAAFFHKLATPYFIVHHHNKEYGSLSERQRTVLKAILHRAKVNYFVSMRNLQVFERQLAFKIPVAKIIKNPVNLEINSVIGNIDWVSNELPSFAVVARLDVNFKGQDILLQTLSSAKWQKRAFKLNLFGQGLHQTYLSELIVFYNLQDKVFIKGQHQEIADIWKNHHLLILPSLSEGAPLSIVEAMLCKRACLVTDVGDCATLVEDNVTGWVACTASVNALDEALERAWQQQPYWQEMGQKAFVKTSAFIDMNPGKTLFEQICP